jgi:surface-anchored protein
VKLTPSFATFALPLVLLGLALTPARAQVPLIDLHAEVSVKIADGALQLHWLIDDEFSGTVDYAPSDAFGLVEADHFVNRPPGAQWDFLGAAAGEPVWFAPQGQMAGRLYLGLSSEALPPSSFSGRPVTMRLTAVSGPGAVSLWQTDVFGTPITSWASSDGLNASDSFVMTSGGHHHFNWGFSQQGRYLLTIEASVTDLGGILFTDTAQFRFDVGVIPEPSATAALFGLVSLAAIALRRRPRANA